MFDGIVMFHCFVSQSEHLDATRGIRETAALVTFARSKRNSMRWITRHFFFKLIKVYQILVRS